MKKLFLILMLFEVGWIDSNCKINQKIVSTRQQLYDHASYVSRDQKNFIAVVRIYKNDENQADALHFSQLLCRMTKKAN